MLEPRGYRLEPRGVGRGGAGRPGAARPDGRPRAPRHRDGRHRRLRGLPPDQGRPAHGVPARGDDHRERGPGEAPRHRGRGRRLRREAVPPAASSSRGWRRWSGSSATRTPSPGRPRSSRSGTGSSSRASARRWTSCSGSSRLRRFLPPQLADLVLDSGDESLARQPPPRDRRRVLRPARVHAVRRAVRAGGGDVGPRRVPPASSESSIVEFEGTLERFTGDGLMVFFNDPVPVRRPGLARGPRWRWRCVTGWPGSRRAGRAAGTTSASASASRRDSPRCGRIGFEGRSDYAAIGSVTNLAARLCAAAGAGQVLVSERVVRGRRGARRRAAGRRARRCAVSAAP